MADQRGGSVLTDVAQLWWSLVHTAIDMITLLFTHLYGLSAAERPSNTLFDPEYHLIDIEMEIMRFRQGSESLKRQMKDLCERKDSCAEQPDCLEMRRSALVDFEQCVESEHARLAEVKMRIASA